MPLWRLRPATSPRDPRWQGRRIWREVVVGAPTAAMARVIASRLEEDPEAPPVGNESLGFRSGFEDEKLYWAVRLNAAEAAAFGGESGPSGIRRAVPWSDRPERYRPSRATTPEERSDEQEKREGPVRPAVPA